jgi:hypothetical protein
MLLERELDFVTAMVTSFNAVQANLTDELVQELATSGGMTGQKYRTMAFKRVGATMAAELGNSFTARNAVTKTMKMTAVMVAIGMILGVTGSKKTLEKTIGSTMENRATQDDALGIGWRVLKQGFRTYVNEANVDQSLFPSLKYCSCIPELALLGIIILMERLYTMDFLVVELQKPYIEWPEILRKQWIGNFALSKEFQMEHMVWEKMFWTSEVSTTNNASNTQFKRGFTPKYYETTIKDKFLVVLPNGQMVWPGENGYTKAMFARLILLMHSQVRAQKASTYRLGGNIISHDGNTAAVTPVNRFVNMAGLPAVTGLNAANSTLIDAITSVATPTDITGSPDENIKGLAASVNSIVVTRPANMAADV